MDEMSSRDRRVVDASTTIWCCTGTTVLRAEAKLQEAKGGILLLMASLRRLILRKDEIREFPRSDTCPPNELPDMILVLVFEASPTVTECG